MFPIVLTDVCFVSLSPGVPRAAVSMAGGAHNPGALSTATAPTPATEELRAIAVRKHVEMSHYFYLSLSSNHEWQI